MKFTNVALATALAAISVAHSGPGTFQVNTELSTDEPAVYLTASKGHINVGSGNKGAQCQGDTPPVGAIFFLQDTHLYLYGSQDQEVLVIASNEGQNRVVYGTGNYQPTDPSFERGGWSIDPQNNLRFQQQSMWLCPSNSASTSLVPGTIFIGNPTSEGGCQQIQSKVTEHDNPVPCYYAYDTL